MALLGLAVLAVAAKSVWIELAPDRLDGDVVVLVLRNVAIALPVVATCVVRFGGAAAWSAVAARRIGFVALTVAAMTLVSWLVFEPLRRRSGSIVGPWLLHAAVNGSMIVLGA